MKSDRFELFGGLTNNNVKQRKTTPHCNDVQTLFMLPWICVSTSIDIRINLLLKKSWLCVPNSTCPKNGIREKQPWAWIVRRLWPLDESMLDFFSTLWWFFFPFELRRRIDNQGAFCIGWKIAIHCNCVRWSKNNTALIYKNGSMATQAPGFSVTISELPD